MRARILVTGGAGFLGIRVVEELLDRGYMNVFVPRFEDYDLRNQEQVNQLFADISPEIVINLAASVGGIHANIQSPGKFFYDNLMIGMNVMEAARQHEVRKFVQMGSACEYPKDAPIPLKESDIWNGYPEFSNAPYGIAKRALLEMGHSYRMQYGMNIIHLLSTNLYGPGDSFGENSHIIPATIRRVSNAMRNGHTNITMWGTGEPTRDFIYVEDAAEGIVLAMENYDGFEPVNLGSGREIKVSEIVQKIAYLLGYKGQITWDATKPDGQPRRVLDTTAALRFGFSADTLLEAGLARTIEWYNAKSLSER